MIYLNSRKRYEDIVDHRSYIHIHISFLHVLSTGVEGATNQINYLNLWDISIFLTTHNYLVNKSWFDKFNRFIITFGNIRRTKRIICVIFCWKPPTVFIWPWRAVKKMFLVIIFLNYISRQKAQAILGEFSNITPTQTVEAWWLDLALWVNWFEPWPGSTLVYKWVPSNLMIEG